MASGFHAPLPFLGLHASPTQAGARSLFAFWAGGASSLAPTESAGPRSLLAFWMGGAAQGPAIVQPPASSPGGGGMPFFFSPPEPRSRDEQDILELLQFAAVLLNE